MNTNPEFTEEENIQNENDFLKMKLMLEQGAKIGTMQTDGSLPADIENQFLKNIIAFEKQFEERKTIKVFDKIERPARFKPVNEIPDNEIENAWNVLNEYLKNYGISLSACSPNISKRELYRFTTDELFEYEMDDMNVPGMMTGFIYDEFHPDYKYDNTSTAVDDCIKQIFKKAPIEWMTYFRKDNLRLNESYPLTEDEFKNIVNRFKQAYEDIELEELEEPACTIDEKICVVNGNYNAKAKLPNEQINLQGTWKVEFENDKELDYWYIVNVQVEGINF